MQLHLYHQILVQQESLEQGQVELAQWLDGAEKFLLSHSLDVDLHKLRDQLDKHKQFFSRVLYYRYVCSFSICSLFRGVHIIFSNFFMIF